MLSDWIGRCAIVYVFVLLLLLYVVPLSLSKRTVSHLSIKLACNRIGPF